MTLALAGIITSCTHQAEPVLIRVHNASAEDYVWIHVDPVASQQSHTDFGALTAGTYSAYIEVDKALELPIVDVGCVYANYSFHPGNISDYTTPGGKYTYSLALQDTGSGKFLTVTLSQE